MNVYMWIALMIILQIIDGTTTYVLVNGGFTTELNPIMLYSMNFFGNLFGLIIPKFIVTVLISLIAIKYWWNKSPRIAFKIMTYIYCVVACSNSAMIILLGAL